ncbi:MAG TPA: hypothetical protein VIK78_19590 [Ruminiclostridium sp.]
MLSKKELEAISHCKATFCSECCAHNSNNDCDNDNVADTALQLLERVETAERIFKDILATGNVGACKGEILEWLGG